MDTPVSMEAGPALAQPVNVPEPSSETQPTSAAEDSSESNVEKEIDEYQLPKKEDLFEKLGVSQTTSKDSETRPKINILFIQSLPREERVDENNTRPQMETFQVNVMDIEGVENESDWNARKEELEEEGLLDTNYLFGGSRMYRAFVEWGKRNGTHVAVGETVNAGQPNESVRQRGYVLKEGGDPQEAFARFKKSPEGKIAICQNLQDEAEMVRNKAEKDGDSGTREQMDRKLGSLRRAEYHELVDFLRNEALHAEERSPSILQEKLQALRRREEELIADGDQDGSSELDAVQAQISQGEHELDEMSTRDVSVQTVAREAIVDAINRNRSQNGEPKLTEDEQRQLLQEENAEAVLLGVMEARGEESSDVQEKLEELNAALRDEGLDVNENTVTELVSELASGKHGMFTEMRRTLQRMSKDENFLGMKAKDVLEKYKADKVEKWGADVIDALGDQVDGERLLRFLLMGEDATYRARELGYKSRKALEKEGKKPIDPERIESFVKNDPVEEIKLLYEGLRAAGIYRTYLGDEPSADMYQNESFLKDIELATSEEKHKLFVQGLLKHMHEDPTKAMFTADGFAYITNLPNKRKHVESRQSSSGGKESE